MKPDTEQRKLAAIMFTDMVGYSALSQRNDRLALELLEEHRGILREIFLRFNGTEIKTMGDAFLAEFNSALEAAQCAIEIQRALAKRNHDVQADRRIELKIGIHIGDVVHRAGDVYGDGVNIASRIEPVAGAGGICVSMDVERQIRNALEARLEKLAPTELKNISVPMDLFRIVLPWERTAAVGKSEIGTRESKTHARQRFRINTLALLGTFVVIAIGFGWWWKIHPPIAASAAVIPQKSIAVLPFDNLSGDPENAYFSEGIQDEVLTRLARIAELKVVSRTSTKKYQSAPANLREIAKQLGVANILEGSVQKAGDQVRVTVQLIDAQNDSHLWGDEFNRKLVDVFAVESEIAARIADTLRAKLTAPEQHAIAVRPTGNSEAHDFYLKGRYNVQKYTAEAIRTGIAYFQKAIELDRDYAPAYSGLAYAYWTSTDLYASPRESMPKMSDAAGKALRLDDTLAEAHVDMGIVRFMFEFNWPAAEQELQRATQLAPNDALAHAYYGWYLVSLGRFDEGIKESTRAEELDPLSPETCTIAGQNCYFARRYDIAADQLRRALELDPGYWFAHLFLGLTCEAEGDYSRAISEMEQARALQSSIAFTASALGHAYAMRGRKPDAQRLLDQLLSRASREYVPAYNLAEIYVGLGEREDALAALDKAYDDRCTFLSFVNDDPRLNTLHSEPRFRELLQRVGLDK